jgi:hypothetical protein
MDRMTSCTGILTGCRIWAGRNQQGIAAVRVGIGYEAGPQRLVAEYLSQRNRNER